MAASGYTPISLYYSTTAAAVPVNTNLVNGELGINIIDGKLYYKDNAGTVQLLASKAAAAGQVTVADANNLSNTGGVSTSGTFYVTFLNNNTTSYQPSKTSATLAINPGTGTLFLGLGSPLGGATNPILAASGSANNYIQSYIYNSSTGTSASADLVVYGNNSSDANGWGDFGFTSSNYSDAAFSVTGANETYLFASAPSGSGTTGNLVYATDSTGSANAHQWYVGGFNQAKGAWKMQITATGLELSTALAVAYGGTGAATLTGLVYGNGTSAMTAATSAQVLSTIGTSANVQFGSFGVGTAASGTTGEIRATNNVTAYYSSDRKLKENIKDIPNALEIVSSIGSKSFDWTDAYVAEHGGEDGYFVQKSDFGVIAQDVQAVFPQAVRAREDGTLAVDYEKLSTLAFGAIKELVKRVETLETKV